MAFLNVDTGAVERAAQNLSQIRSALDESARAMAGPMTELMPAASDEISSALAGVFGNIGQEFHAMNAQVAQLHANLVGSMSAGAAAYAQAEVTNGAGLGAQMSSAVNTVGSDLRGLAAQPAEFIGEGLLDGGFSVGSVGNAIVNGGATLSTHGAGLSTVANLGASHLSAAGLADATIGRDLARVVAGGPAGAILQTGGSVFQGLGDGVELLGFAEESAGAAVIQSF